MDKKVVKFDLNPKSVKIKEILETKDFIAIEVWAISNAYPNNNASHFPETTMIRNVEQGNFYDKPVLGKWNSINQDYEVHNSVIKYDNEFDTVYFDYENGECPMGTIRQSDVVEIRKDDNGLTWVVFTAVLWTKYNYQAVKKLLKSKRKKVSVEVSVFKSHIDENDIEIFDEWSFDGVTILGNLPNSKVPAESGIQNAHLTVLEKLEEALFSKQMKVVQFECANYNNVINSDESDLYKNNKTKEGFKLFTYEQKREMLEAALREKLFKDDCDFWLWVADIDDSNVWFSMCGEYYVAPYTITTSEDGENGESQTVIDVNTEEMKKQLRAWTDFVEDNDNDNPDNDDDDDRDNNDNDSQQNQMSNDGMCNFTAVIDGETFTGDELLSKYLSEVSAYQVEKQEAFEKYESLKQEFEELKAAGESFEAQIDSLNSEKADFEAQIETLSAEKAKFEQDIESITLERDNFKAENETLKTEVGELNSKIVTAQYQQLADKAVAFAKEQGLDDKKCNEFSDKCKAGEYETFEAVKKDIVYAAFESGSVRQTEEFVFKINKPEATNKDVDVKKDAFSGCREIINK